MMVSMQNEQEIINTLKKQRQELSQHPKLGNLVKLYDACIDLHERNWLVNQGIILKSSTPIDFKPLIDGISEENKRNNEELELIEKCKDCSNVETDEQIRFIKMNKLGMLTLDD
jgi:hypothetical protein